MNHTATYSPDDNKLRLYPAHRLDKEEYDRVKRHGFAWAPKQELFVAPAWSPDREDLLIELAGEIGDEDTSLVDRAEARADRFEDYSEKRGREAEGARAAVARIADNIPFGQPILVGHHSEKRARRDAEKIENGMHQAVKLWRTSQYWADRAAGALAHAKYLERPDVRFRRIKGIESDKRKLLKDREHMLDMLRKWAEIAQANAAKPEAPEVRQLAMTLAGYCTYSCRLLVPAELNRGTFGRDSAYDALRWEENPVTVAQVCEWAAAAMVRWTNPEHRTYRWEQHYDNRLAYERAMLAEAGGVASDKWQIEVGGQVQAHGEWLTVLRINRSNGQINSVTTNKGRWYSTRVRIEDVKDYRPATEEAKAKAKAATKLPPLVNYPGDGFTPMTKDEYDRKVRCQMAVTRIEKATETHGAHRQRTAMKNGYSGIGPVFITDIKVIERPAAGAAAPRPTFTPEVIVTATRPRPVEDPRDAEFRALEQSAKAGVQVVSANQLFPTPAALAERMVEEAAIRDGCTVLEPSAGTGAIIRAIRDRAHGYALTAVEINAELASRLRVLAQVDDCHRADFLEWEPGRQFDRILMNPPFERGADIEHIRRAFKLLAPGGRLVAICANGPRQTMELKPWAEKQGGTWEELPDDTFREQGTGVRTCLLTLCA